MNYNGRWIKAYAKMMEQPWFFHGGKGLLWMYLLFKASYKAENGLERGQLRASWDIISADTDLTVKQIRRALAFFETEEMITTEVSAYKRGSTIYTICKYNDYQGEGKIYTSKFEERGELNNTKSLGKTYDNGKTGANEGRIEGRIGGRIEGRIEMPVNIEENAIMEKSEGESSGRIEGRTRISGPDIGPLVNKDLDQKKESSKNKRKNLSSIEKREILVRSLNAIKTEEDDIALKNDRLSSIYLQMLKVIGLESSIIDGLKHGEHYDWMLNDAAYIISDNPIDRIWEGLVDFLMDSTVPHWPELLRKHQRKFWMKKFSEWLKEHNPETVAKTEAEAIEQKNFKRERSGFLRRMGVAETTKQEEQI